MSQEQDSFIINKENIYLDSCKPQEIIRQASPSSGIEKVKNEINNLYSWEAGVKVEDEFLNRCVSQNNFTPVKEEKKIRTEKYQMRQENRKSEQKGTVMPTTSKSQPTFNSSLPSTSAGLKSQGKTCEELANELKEKGNHYVKLMDYENAIRCYTEAIDNYNENPVYFANRALCYLKLEKYEESIKDCNVAIKLDPKYTKAIYRRMQIYENLGKNKSAFENCKMVLNIEPTNAEAISSFERIKKKLNFKEFEEISSSSKTKLSTNFKNLPNDVVEIETINKPSHLRSKIPLRRIPITEIIEKPSSSNKINKELESNSIPVNHGTNEDKIELKHKIVNERLKSKEIPQKISLLSSVHANEFSHEKMKTIDLISPTKPAEFHRTWKDLTKEQKYLYLKTIEPSNVNQILGCGLNSDILSDIISILSDYYINNGEKIGKLLANLTNHSEIGILSCFLSENDRKGISKLVDYMQKQNDEIEYIEKIKMKFSLKN